jgi:hypothetical protein
VVESFARPPQEVPLIVKQQSMQIERLMDKIQMRKKKQPFTNKVMSSKATGQVELRSQGSMRGEEGRATLQLLDLQPSQIALKEAGRSTVKTEIIQDDEYFNSQTP